MVGRASGAVVPGRSATRASPAPAPPSSVFALPFSADGAFHFGNLARNAVIGPAFFNTDLSLIKKTRFGGTTLELRAEAFNVFNHPNLGNPGRIATVGSTSFGVITATRLPTGDSGLGAPDPVRGEGAVLVE